MGDGIVIPKQVGFRSQFYDNNNSIFSNMSWHTSSCTQIWVFSVGRGTAAFVRTGLNQGFIIDMGKNDDFDPAAFIEKEFIPKLAPYPATAGNSIAQAILSHPHTDHIASCEMLLDGNALYPSLLTCPHDKDFPDGKPSDEKLNWSRIVNRDGSDDVIATYKKLYENRSIPLQTIQYNASLTIPYLQYGIYYLRPPICETLHESNDNHYGNSTSIMAYFRHGNQSILFPGDMTPEGMKQVLDEGEGSQKRYTCFDLSVSRKHPKWHLETCDQPSLNSLLKSLGLTILVAPHHGLESCYSSELYDALKGNKPELVVISERRHVNENDGYIDGRYQSEDGSSGLNVEVDGKAENRRSITTVNSQHILIIFSGAGAPKIYADKDIDKLLRIANS